MLGAGIAASEGTFVTVTGNVVMARNVASSAGGAMFLDAPAILKVNGTQFVGNKAGQSGGAMLVFSAGIRGDFATISHCGFEDNKASDAGGALFIGGGFVFIHGSDFHSNIAGEWLRKNLLDNVFSFNSRSVYRTSRC